MAVVGPDEYIDGGTFSMTNVEIATDADRILVLRPMADPPQYTSPSRTAVLDRALVLEPSTRACESFGANPFDPDARGIAAVLGYEDGLAAEEAVRELLGGEW